MWLPEDFLELYLDLKDHLFYALVICRTIL